MLCAGQGRVEIEHRPALGGQEAGLGRISPQTWPASHIPAGNVYAMNRPVWNSCGKAMLTSQEVALGEAVGGGENMRLVHRPSGPLHLQSDISNVSSFLRG